MKLKLPTAITAVLLLGAVACTNPGNDTGSAPSGTEGTVFQSIINVAPADGARALTKGTNLVLTFDGSLDNSVFGTVSITSPPITFANGTNCTMTFSTTAEADDTVTIDPDDTLAGIVYRGLSVTGFQDAAGQAVPDDSFSGYDMGVDDPMAFYMPANGNANDESGNNLTTEVLGATLTADRHGSPNRAYDFDGADDRIRLAGDVLDLHGGDMAITAWVSADDLSSTGRGIFSKVQSSTSGYTLRTDGAKLNFSGALNNQVSSTGTLTTGTWHHVAVVHTASGRNTYFYIDGAAAGSGALTSAVASSDDEPQIGVDLLGTSAQYFNGRIDDVRVYDHALAASEIKALYDVEKP